MIILCVGDMMKWMFVILLLAYRGLAFGQEVQPVIPASAVGIENSSDFFKPISQDPFRFAFASQPLFSNQFSIRRIPSINHLPSLFCKLEYKLESKSKLAPRFRLGSLQYTEWMEGKTDLYLRYDK